MRNTLTIDRGSLHAQPWHAFPEQQGVRQKILWRDERDGSYAGLLRLDPGAHMTAHAHHRSAHHIWVVQGTCATSDQTLPKDSYCFVPAGMKHDLVEVGFEGCTIFYLYIRAPR